MPSALPLGPQSCPIQLFLRVPFDRLLADPTRTIKGFLKRLKNQSRRGTFPSARPLAIVPNPFQKHGVGDFNILLKSSHPRRMIARITAQRGLGTRHPIYIDTDAKSPNQAIPCFDDHAVRVHDWRGLKLVSSGPQSKPRLMARSVSGIGNRRSCQVFPATHPTRWKPFATKSQQSWLPFASRLR